MCSSSAQVQSVNCVKTFVYSKYLLWNICVAPYSFWPLDVYSVNKCSPHCIEMIYICDFKCNRSMIKQIVKCGRNSIYKSLSDTVNRHTVGSATDKQHLQMSEQWTRNQLPKHFDTEKIFPSLQLWKSYNILFCYNCDLPITLKCAHVYCTDNTNVVTFVVYDKRKTYGFVLNF